MMPTGSQRRAVRASRRQVSQSAPLQAARYAQSSLRSACKLARTGRLFSVALGRNTMATLLSRLRSAFQSTGPDIRPMLQRVLLLASIALIAAGAPARAEVAAAPFDGSLQRLAEILGALHYLRGICGADEGQKWRNEMQSLVDAEAPQGDRRARMIASFNRGYRGYQQTYRTCTPAADLVIRRYLEEGSKIIRDVTARYAN
jgi:uncharacterized protein (TIGR02301 family)